jgi:hypothetical protein
MVIAVTWSTTPALTAEQLMRSRYGFHLRKSALFRLLLNRASKTESTEKII